jgi:hypothetical protein
VKWEAFRAACPDIALMADERFARDQLVMLGTLRADGSPRISPCEVDFAVGHLVLGMMWRSQKALDLQRDPRIVVHSVTSNKEGTDGDIKIYGRAEETHNAAIREACKDATEARSDWRPPDRAHFFLVEVKRAGYLVFGDDGHGLAWTPADGLRRLNMPTE